MVPIAYRTGDALEPVRLDPTNEIIIAHIVNDVGLFGASFAKAVANRYPVARTRYRDWFQGAHLDNPNSGTPFELGMVQIFPLDPSIWMAHLLAQHGVRSAVNTVPLDLDALENRLWLLGRKIEGHGCMHQVGTEVHMPEIGCGLAGGSWKRVEPLVNRFLSEKDIPVTVYRLP